jgi:hypothetical protein
MGKKTLEEIGKVLLVSIISVLVSVTATRRVLLDSKLDKSEFDRYVDKHESTHNDEQNDIKEVKEMVLFLYEEEIKKANR